MNFLEANSNPKQLSPQTLAFIGDAVYDLIVREYLVKQANRPVGELNQLKVKLVNCQSQAKYAAMLMGDLTEDEISVYKRGRNANTANTPKNSSHADYHSATGLEALFGYLYLTNQTERIKELFFKILSDT
jgi:ribonuclease-3 family protein